MGTDNDAAAIQIMSWSSGGDSTHMDNSIYMVLQLNVLVTVSELVILILLMVI